MSSDTDISALYHEFADALTEVLAENTAGPARRGRLARARAAVKKHPTITSMNIFWPSKPRSNSGKPYKTPVSEPRALSRGFSLQIFGSRSLASRRHVFSMALLYGPAVRCKPDVTIWR